MAESMDSDKIKILFIALDMDLGGLQRVINIIIQRLNKELFIPYLCCLDRGGIFGEELESKGIKSYILQRKPGPFDVKLFKKLCRILVENEIDVIHSQNGCTFYAALAGKLTGVKGIVHTDHGRLVPDKRSAVWEDWLSSFMIDRFIGVSESLTEYLASAVKINRKKLMTVVNGVDTDKFIPLDSNQRQKLRSAMGLGVEDRIIGTVCRLDPIKNLEFLIGSLPVICRSLPGVKLLIAGDGPSREHLIRYAESVGMSSRVIFMGRTATVESVLPMFDLYACTSLSEGTSMTILEAMSCGVPVIASDVGGNRGLVDPSSGVLFPLNDMDTFVKNVIALFKDPQRLMEMGSCGRKKAEKDYSLGRFVNRYEGLYRSLSRSANGNV
ncbi:MAG: glycosyltransferase [Candidatus Manganitrophus sp. SA1]|nr:glycosyltransferase [Candidatus Manganitrophus morganii]